MKHKKRIFLSGTRNMANRGVQALVMSIMKYCNEQDICSFTILSDDVDRDTLLFRNIMARYDINFINERNPLYAKVVSKIIAYLPSWLGLLVIKAMSCLPWRMLGVKNMSDHDYSISTGGDLYTPEYGFPVLQMSRDLKLKKESNWMLFGASMNKFNDGEMLIIKFLDRMPNIYVRESKSLEYLRSHGIETKLCFDPAFYLTYNRSQVTQNKIGINLSPYVIRNIKDIEVYAKLINSFRECGYTVVYLSHVYNNSNDGDRKIFHELNSVLETPIIDETFGLDASEAKGLISSLKLVISARTHVCIAGYSSGVPTVAISYSYKSIGLNNDITSDAFFIRLPDQELNFHPKVVIERYPINQAISYTLNSIETNKKIFTEFLNAK